MASVSEFSWDQAIWMAVRAWMAKICPDDASTIKGSQKPPVQIQTRHVNGSPSPWEAART